MKTSDLMKQIKSNIDAQNDAPNRPAPIRSLSSRANTISRPTTKRTKYSPGTVLPPIPPKICMQNHTVAMPWTQKDWQERKEQILAPIKSIQELNNRMFVLYKNRITNRCITMLVDSAMSSGFDKDRFMNRTIPAMQKLVMSAHKCLRDVPILMQQVCKSIRLTSRQCSTILALMWFNAFDYDYVSKELLRYLALPSMLDMIVKQNKFAFMCIMGYFDVCGSGMPPHDVIFVRRTTDMPPLSDMQLPQLCTGDGSVDNAEPRMHVVYASECVGNEVFSLKSSEAVSMLIRPESIVALLINTILVDTEILAVYGAYMCADTYGYSSSAVYRMPTCVAETDCMLFIPSETSTQQQFSTDRSFVLDIHRLYVAFSMPAADGAQIATGNWAPSIGSCNLYVKFLQQLIAAAMANRTLVYYSGGSDFEDQMTEFYSWARDNELSVNGLIDLYQDVVENEYCDSRFNLFKSMMQMDDLL